MDVVSEHPIPGGTYYDVHTGGDELEVEARSSSAGARAISVTGAQAHECPVDHRLVLPRILHIPYNRRNDGVSGELETGNVSMLFKSS